MYDNILNRVRVFMMVIDQHYITRCAQNVAPSTMMAIVKTESNGNPLAINLNYGYRLSYQPRSYKQATAWVNYLEKNGYNFDVGITQVNIKNIHKFGYKAVDALEPCLNLKIGAKILHRNYFSAVKVSLNSQEALFKAISAYNTGNYRAGFSNGYVQKVVYNAHGATPDIQ
jgi:type IV secretion system protein VirB1